MHAIRAFAIALAAVVTIAGDMVLAPATAQNSCTRAEIAAGVDKAGAELRRVNAETFPRLQAKMRQLKELKNWSDGDYQEQAAALLQDKRTQELDRIANELLARIDAIGSQSGDEKVDCVVLAELEAASAELSATMRAKAGHAHGLLDAIIAGTNAGGASPSGGPSSVAPPSATPPASAPLGTQGAPAVQPKSDQVGRSGSLPPVVEPKAPAAPKATTPEPPRRAPAAPQSSWTTTTEQGQAVAQAPISPMPAPLTPPTSPSVTPPMPPQMQPRQDDDGFSIDEIREASRGFFGQVSTGLASVIEYAFSKSGRPSAYVLGNEGGGAFLAGLRYGSGSLFTRDGGSRKVYWHGPSIGYDVGLAGSKTMFLIYNMRDPESLFARFTGVDGSAYVVGGVGVTFLTDGRVIMAPIRSGLGLRVGANIGYVRFTPTATWNPF